ncbi:MAG: hypothetical protein NZ873_01045 [Crenarchaeota archaeon]|nr:hypothetical protein [Thermoproteota archaeon]MDW8033734.1 hypothetical protein [Nitrososphaerota archaeon]
MSEFIKKYEEDRGLSEKIASYIPGYRGYKQKEVRREADKLLRDFMVRKLEAARSGLKNVVREIADANAVELFKTLNRINAIMDRVINKVEHADYGYSGFFNLIKIHEDELDRILDYDYKLVGACDEISRLAVETSSAANAGSLDVIPNLLKRLESKLVEFESAFSSREEAIVSIKGGV